MGERRWTRGRQCDHSALLESGRAGHHRDRGDLSEGKTVTVLMKIPFRDAYPHLAGAQTLDELEEGLEALMK